MVWRYLEFPVLKSIHDDGCEALCLPSQGVASLLSSGGAAGEARRPGQPWRRRRRRRRRKKKKKKRGRHKAY